MIKSKILVTRKDTGKAINVINGEFQSEESLDSWCINQSKGIYDYAPIIGTRDLSGEEPSGPGKSPSKRKSSPSNGTRKRRTTKAKGK